MPANGQINQPSIHPSIRHSRQTKALISQATMHQPDTPNSPCEEIVPQAEKAMLLGKLVSGLQDTMVAWVGLEPNSPTTVSHLM
jgi:hypothetical protein